MNPLPTVILIVAILQLARPQTTTDSSAAEDELDYYYHTASNLIAGQACLRLRNISGTIFEDNVVKTSTSPLVNEFKKNLTKFEDIYPYFINFGHNDTLLRTFSNIVTDFSRQEAPTHDKDFRYVKRLLKNVGINEVFKEYKKDFKTILPKLESFKEDIADTGHKNWLNDLRECKEFECFLNCYRKNMFTTKDHFVSFLQQRLTEMTTYFVTNASRFGNDVLQDQRLPQASPLLQQNIEYLLQMIDLCEDIFQLYFLPFSFNNLMSYFVSESRVSFDELLLIIEILNDHGYEELLSNHRKAYDKFLQQDLLEEYERAKATLSEEQLMEDKSFWSTFEKLKGAPTFKERVAIVNDASKQDFAVKRI